MTKKIGWRPNTRKHYDPTKPFNPFYPPDDTPPEVLDAFWGDDGEPIKPIERTPDGEAILPWHKKKEK